MAEIAVIMHVLRLDCSIAAERIVEPERGKSVCCALAVDKGQNLLGKA